MEEPIMNGNGRGGNNRRRPAKHRERETDNWQNNPQRSGKKKADKPRYDKNRGVFVDRPKWIPVKPPAEPLPSPDCPYCGKPIRDISSAVTDKTTGEPAHFDCVIGKIAENESLGQGDAVTYIGGGRFGIVHFNNPQELRNFSIKKIFEWENKDNRAEWRKTVADHFSVT
jgi:hypothetical protein